MQPDGLHYLCLACHERGVLLRWGGIMDFSSQKCPKCGEEYHRCDGQLEGITIENQTCDNRSAAS